MIANVTEMPRLVCQDLSQLMGVDYFLCCFVCVAFFLSICQLCHCLPLHTVNDILGSCYYFIILDRNTGVGVLWTIQLRSWWTWGIGFNSTLTHEARRSKSQIWELSSENDISVQEMGRSWQFKGGAFRCQAVLAPPLSYHVRSVSCCSMPGPDWI